MRALSQVLKIFLRNAELSENLEEQRRADFPAAVNGNSHGASVRMVPTLVAAGLPRPRKPELAGCILEVAGRTARHARFRWYRQASHSFIESRTDLVSRCLCSNYCTVTNRDLNVPSALTRGLSVSLNTPLAIESMHIVRNATRLRDIAFNTWF